jgi:hypothetical protein
MTTYALAALVNGHQFHAQSGALLSGGKINTYFAGTTTPAATYTDSTGATPNANPIIIGSDGRPASAGNPIEVWIPIGVSYKFQVLDSSNVVQATYDNIPSMGDGTLSSASYTAPFSGSVVRTLLSKQSDIVSVKDFGATGDGISDDTASMQAAHNTGRVVLYPSGTYNFTSLSFVSGGMAGQGQGQTILNCTASGTSDCITFTGHGFSGSQVPLFSDFSIQAASKTGGSAINLATPGSFEVSNPQFRAINFLNCYIGLHFSKASYFNVYNCTFSTCQVGMVVENQNNPDSGDSTILGCFFNCVIAGIEYLSSGGLKIECNKFLSQSVNSYGILLEYNATISGSGDLFIVGNSIEVPIPIYLSRLSGSFGFGYIIISGNEIGVGSATNPGIGTDASGFLNSISITGNIIITNGAASFGIYLVNVNGFLIGDNILLGQTGGTGITVDALSNGKIGKNTYKSWTTPISNASTSVVIDTDIQTGVVNQATSVGYGSLFATNISVTFTKAFLVAPTVECFGSGGSGGATGMAGFATAVTTSGFTFNLIAASNAGTASGYWVAHGIMG